MSSYCNCPCHRRNDSNEDMSIKAWMKRKSPMTHESKAQPCNAVPNPNPQPRPPKPRRCIEMTIKIGADDWDELLGVLRQLHIDLYDERQGSISIATGGWGSGWTVEGTVDPSRTGDRYRTELKQWSEYRRSVPRIRTETYSSEPQSQETIDASHANSSAFVAVSDLEKPQEGEG